MPMQLPPEGFGPQGRAQKRRSEITVANLFGKMARRVISYSPVDTGQFLGNWRFAIGTPDLTYVPVTRASPAASLGGRKLRQAQLKNRSAAERDAIQRLLAVLPQVSLGRRVFMTNSAPYANRLENGWSGQAPSGMVKLALAELAPLYREAAIEVGPVGYGGYQAATR